MKKITTVLVLLLITSALFAAGDISVRLGGAFSLVAAKNPHSAINKPTDVDKNELVDYDLTMVNSAGFGFDTGLVFGLSSDYNLYLDFSMTFPAKVSVGDYESTPGDLKNLYDSFKSDFEYIEDYTSIYGSSFLTNLELHVGFTKKINLGESPINLNIGGGLGYRRIKEGFKMTMRKDSDFYCFDLFETISHLSLDFHADVAYKFNDNFAVCAVLMPGVSFYSASKFYATWEDKTEDEKIVHNLKPIRSTIYYGDDKEKSGMYPKYENSGFAAGFTLAARIGVSYTF